MWVSTPTLDGVEQLIDLRLGSLDSEITELTAVGSQLYFLADNGLTGLELWTSDGTAGGTVLVQDFEPGDADSTLEQLTAHNGELYFTDGDQRLYVTDGTPAGTILLKEFFGKVGQLQSTDQGLLFRAMMD